MVCLLIRNISKNFMSLSMETFKTIGTHSGVFHCDEVLGCAMLKFLSPNAKITRTRDLEKLSHCDIVIDVGGVYDPEKLRFDHHQNTFDHSMSTVIPGKKSTIKLSSAGLVYCHFGKKIIKSVLGTISDKDLEKIFDRMYENFVQEIDAIDNGIPICKGEVAYHISTSLSSRVKLLNKRWNEVDYNEEDAFMHAMELVSKEFKSRLHYLANDWLPARDIVLQAVLNRFEVHKSGEIMELSQNCPWKSHFFEIEKELNPQPPIKFVIFTDISKAWRVQAVSLDEESFLLRVPLLESWRGVRGEELLEKSGIKGIIFVHSSGFIGGCENREGAIEMAVRTIAANSNATASE